jgi:hypothetical protein
MGKGDGVSYDTDAIRDKISMLDLLAKDGVHVVRKGGRWFACCPFHEEKSASFCVTERTGLFTCFGCGAGKKDSGIKGDIFGYWMATRGVDFPTAASALALLSGTGEMPDGSRLPPRKIIDTQAVYYPPPLEGCNLDQWNEGVRWLASNEEWQNRLARWRGYAMDTVKVMIEKGRIGCPIYFQARQWAFPVEPIREDGTTYLAGWHVRLDPKKAGERALWHFVPGSAADRPSIGAWPMVIGNPLAAKAVLFFEGEWDALAGADVCGWGIEKRSANVAIFGLRGGRNLRHMLLWSWPEEAQSFMFPDNDETGLSWADPDGFASMVRLRSRATHVWTVRGVKDFNDLHRRGGTRSREEFLKFLREHFLAGEKTRKKRKPKESRD